MLLATLLLVGVLLVACGQASGGPAEPVLRVGSQKGGDKVLLRASGALEGAPYKVEWSDFPAAQHLLEAISADAVDVGLVGDAPFLFAYAAGARIKAVQGVQGASGGRSTVLLVPKDSSIRSEADLKGKRIATGRGSIGHYLLLRVLERAGLKPSDVTIVFLAPSDAKAAFATGSVDAWSSWSPYVQLAQRDGARALTDGQGVMSGYGFQVASVAAISGKRAILQDYLKRLAAAERWGRAHPDQYGKLLAQETGLDPDIAAAVVRSTARQPAAITPAVVAEEQAVLKRFQDAGAVSGRPDLAAGFETAFNATVEP